jgi:hypothetical protein
MLEKAPDKGRGQVSSCPLGCRPIHHSTGTFIQPYGGAQRVIPPTKKGAPVSRGGPLLARLLYATGRGASLRARRAKPALVLNSAVASVQRPQK